jgi:hypothetical protein
MQGTIHNCFFGFLLVKFKGHKAPIPSHLHKWNFNCTKKKIPLHTANQYDSNVLEKNPCPRVKQKGYLQIAPTS